MRAGEYTLTQGIHIDRSNVSILGEPGTVLRLADAVDQPVILIGTDTETPTENDTIDDVWIEGLELDGNRDGQTQETDPNRPWIRNNTIDVRAVHDLWIERVDAHSAASGGLVVSWNSATIYVSQSTFSNNVFDGVALYASEGIHLADFDSLDNDAAGLSLDNDMFDVQFSGGRLANNGDVGIFARHSTDLVFQDLVVSDNASHGAFLSHESMDNGTGINRLLFTGVSFLDNDGYGLWMASPESQSADNALLACVFGGNTSGPVMLDQDADLSLEAIVYLP